MRSVLTATVGLLVGAEALGQASFTRIHSGVTGERTEVYGLSGDGSTVIGSVVRQNSKSTFRWKPYSGLSYATEMEGYHAQIRGISYDGSVFVGDGNRYGEYQSAFKWGDSSGFQVVPASGPSSNPYGKGVSGDGTTLVGRSNQAFRVRGNGVIETLAPLTGHTMSAAQGATWDGSTVVGGSVLSNVSTAVKWDAAGAPTALPLGLPSEYSTSAELISSNGRVVVGAANWNSRLHVWRWTGTGNATILSHPFDSDMVLTAMSADGSAIVGMSGSFDPRYYSIDPYIWTEQRGTMRVRSLLVEAGLGPDLNGWQLGEVWGVARTPTELRIAGTMTSGGQSQGYLAIVPVPEPTSCAALGAMAIGLVFRKKRRG